MAPAVRATVRGVDRRNMSGTIVMGCIAAVNRQRLTPRLSGEGDRVHTIRQLERNSLVEAGLGLLIIGPSDIGDSRRARAHSAACARWLILSGVIARTKHQARQ